MTAEITNLEEFKDKFASLMAAQTALIASGIEPSPSLSSKIIDEFVQQFMIATPMPAQRASAGWVTISSLTGDIPADFEGVLYDSQDEAQGVLDRFLDDRAYLSHHDYRVVEATYYV